jgi:hypothetical protein
MRCLSWSIALVLLSLSQEPLLAQAPGRGAGPDERLDYLLQSWQGRQFDELRSVWGRETQRRTRGANSVYVYEVRNRVRASMLSGQVSIHPDTLVCTVLFDVDDTDTIVRTGRTGGGRTCWRTFRNRTPP